MLKSKIRNLRNRWRNIRLFAATVRSPGSVRHAFDGHVILAWWWVIVLKLHGRPLQKDIPLSDRCERIADGFRFYGLLYRVLAAVFFASALVCLAGELASPFWISLFAAGGAYLWVVAGLAFSGASEFLVSDGQRIWHLVAFLFFVSVFLSTVTVAICL